MFSQNNCTGSVTTPLGTDVLLFSRMQGHEEMSRLFEYEVELFCETKQLDINQLLGQGMTVELTLPSGGNRYFHGAVTQFRHQGSTADREFFLYRAVLRPWLWFLTRTSDCRIFQELSVPDIIKKIFGENGFSDFKLSLTQTYQEREYCVQYRETDFNFVSRLMEYEGLHYYFSHEQGKHTLVITDSVNGYQTIADYSSIPYYPSENHGHREDHIFEWHNYHEVQSGSYVLDDFDFEKPKSDLLSKFVNSKSHTHADGEYYDYPGNYLTTSLGETYATARLDELQTNHAVIRGKANALGLSTGMLFTLTEHYIEQENAKHLVTATDFFIESNRSHSTKATTELSYECSFSAIPSTQQFRPGRTTRVPFVQGPQTAIVVGKEGEEIWTDKYGRVKVQFHWDRLGTNNENSSCWVRVSHPTAGKNWGWISLPRIGQEVIVSFLEGNPDRPIITGRVYNGEQMPPYELPANQTQSGIKTRSSKAGTAENFNEIRFEDKKDSEEVYVHAEKDFNCVIENNETRKIGLDKKDKGNQTIEIHNDRTITLNEGHDTLTVKKGNRITNVDTGDNTLNVKQGHRETNVDTGNNTLNVKQGNRETNVNTGNDTLNVKQGNRITNVDTGDNTLNVKTGNRVTNVNTGNNTLTVKTGNRETNINTGNDTTNVKLGNHLVNVNAGKSTIDAMTSIELKVGGNSIKIDQSGITIKGIMVTIEGTATLDAKSPLTTVKADGVLTLKGSMTMIN